MSHFLEGTHKLLRGDFGGQKRGPKRAIFGHNKFSLLFFPALADGSHPTSQVSQKTIFVKGWFWRMCPRSGFRSGGTYESTLVSVFVPGEHPNVPSFRFRSSAVPKRVRSKRGQMQKRAHAHQRAQMSAKERRRESAKRAQLAQNGAKERKRALPRKSCKQPGLKQPGLGTAKFKGRKNTPTPSLRRILKPNQNHFLPTLKPPFPWKLAEIGKLKPKMKTMVLVFTMGSVKGIFCTP